MNSAAVNAHRDKLLCVEKLSVLLDWGGLEELDHVATWAQGWQEAIRGQTHASLSPSGQMQFQELWRQVNKLLWMWWVLNAYYFYLIDCLANSVFL